ncbi:hypothetical protein [Chitinophaga alhagiae]|uniref:hypothetical protein n=1 Tax=Chitinophaga alhagiae TaxID=2203219 RepID=UPI0013006598|nr:hypothetical protein [Chitinophaga alhagiae]
MLFSFNKKKEKVLEKGGVTVCASMRDFNKEEYFVKKVEAAAAVLGKWGLPKELMAQ